MITISIKDAVFLVLLVALLVLIIYLIVMVANLIKTLKKANLVIDDVQRMSTIAADKTESVNNKLDKYADKVSNFVGKVKSEGSSINRLYNRKLNRNSAKMAKMDKINRRRIRRKNRPDKERLTDYTK